MLMDGSDIESCEEYICSKIVAMFVDSDAVRLIVARVILTAGLVLDF